MFIYSSVALTYDIPRGIGIQDDDFATCSISDEDNEWKTLTKKYFADECLVDNRQTILEPQNEWKAIGKVIEFQELKVPRDDGVEVLVAGGTGQSDSDGFGYTAAHVLQKVR